MGLRSSSGHWTDEIDPRGNRRQLHTVDGELNDPEDGSAAYRLFYGRHGSLHSETHFRNGKAQDPEDGSAAWRVYNPDGSIALEMHYQDGERADD